MSINKTTNRTIDETVEKNINTSVDENVEETLDESLNEISEESTLEDADTVFDDDFEIRYEGDFPDFPKPKDDNYKDVLASLSELDNTRKINYLEENYTASFDTDENGNPTLDSALKDSAKNSKVDVKKVASIILILCIVGILFVMLGKYL